MIGWKNAQVKDLGLPECGQACLSSKDAMVASLPTAMNAGID
jgi:hypothetical protein